MFMKATHQPNLKPLLFYTGIFIASVCLIVAPTTHAHASNDCNNTDIVQLCGGEDGDDGISGIDGIDGGDGVSLPPNVPGAFGTRGLNGMDGFSGTDGVNGEDGNSISLVIDGAPVTSVNIRGNGGDGGDGGRGGNGGDGGDGGNGSDIITIFPIIVLGTNGLPGYNGGDGGQGGDGGDAGDGGDGGDAGNGSTIFFSNQSPVNGDLTLISRGGDGGNAGFSGIPGNGGDGGDGGNGGFGGASGPNPFSGFVGLGGRGGNGGFGGHGGEEGRVRDYGDPGYGGDGGEIIVNLRAPVSGDVIVESIGGNAGYIPESPINNSPGLGGDGGNAGLPGIGLGNLGLGTPGIDGLDAFDRFIPPVQDYDHRNGEGDDIVVGILNGATVNGEIHASTTGTATLYFSLTVEVETQAEFDAIVQELDNADPSGDEITINGETYRWREFDEIGHSLNMEVPEPTTGALIVTKSVSWNGVTPDLTTIFEICITGMRIVNPDCQRTDWNGGTLRWTDLEPGLYTVTEAPPPDWGVTLPRSPILVEAGEVATAYVSNRLRLGTLIVTKVVDWNGAIPDESTIFQICVTGPSYPDGDCRFSDWDGGTLTWANLIPGAYTVTESEAIGWATALPRAELVVDPGETVETFITNTLNTGSISVGKVVNWGGADPDTARTFTICVDSPLFNAPDCRSIGFNGGMLDFAGLPPGDYRVYELDPGSDWSVSGGGLVTVTPGTATATTITNSYSPPPPPPSCTGAVNTLVGTIVVTGQTATGTITNTGVADCTFDLGIASYQKFDDVIDNQQLFNATTATVIIPAGSNTTLTVELPACATQVDLFYGAVLTSLNGQRYGERLLAAIHEDGTGYCTP